MKNLIEYLLESLINAEDLNKYLSFEDCTKEEAQKFLKKDDNYKRLLISNKKVINSEINYFDDSWHYKIMYKDKVIGYMAATTLEVIIKIAGKSIDIHSLCYNYLTNGHGKYGDAAYITYLIMDERMKKKLDINEFSLIKIFFNKLIEDFQESDIKYIFCSGKDERISRLYQKLGGFTTIPFDDFYKYFEKKYSAKVLERMKESFVQIKDVLPNILYKKI